MAEKKGLTLSIDIAPGLHSVTSDQRRVEQILLNLLNNAIKFSERGSIALSAQLLPNNAQHDLVTSWPAVCIRVSDTGIGVKAEDLVKLFQPFHQVDVGLGRQREGTGLGLAICRRLATLLGGSISAESRWGVGSTFSVMFPIAPREVEL
jgi:signal transduction histidine kinase